MAEVIGLVASVIQVAASGIKLSRTLRDYSSAVQGSEKRLKGLDKDIYFTSGIISELGTLLNDPRAQALISERSIELTREIVAEFEGMFQAIQDVIETIRADSLGKWKMYFRESKIALLLSNLDRLKGNLNLLMGVIKNASQISTEHPNDATMIAHRINILELMVEKEEYTQRYLDEKRKYDDLMARVNSNSTLGSISTVHTSISIVGPSSYWRSQMIDEEPEASQHLTSYGFSESKEKASEPEASTSREIQPTESTAYTYSTPEPAISSDKAKQDALLLRKELARLKASVGAMEHATIHTATAAQPSAAATAFIYPTIREDTENVEPLSLPSSVPEVPPKPAPKPKPQSGQKRKAAAEMTKKVAKGAGYAAVGATAIALFPITLPVWFFWRMKRSNLKQGSANHYEVWDGVEPAYGIAEHEQPSPYYGYDSHAIPAELPGPHEYRYNARPEMTLVSELTNQESRYYY